MTVKMLSPKELNDYVNKKLPNWSRSKIHQAFKGLHGTRPRCATNGPGEFQCTEALAYVNCASCLKWMRGPFGQ